jgi:ketosteroid isomerase-like protein
MSAQDIETLKAGYDAFARQDMEAVMAAFHDDIEWVQPDSLPTGGRYRGRDEVMGFFGRLSEIWEQLSVEPTEFLDAGDAIVAIVRLRGRARAGSFDGDAAHVWRMRDGRAAAFTEYIDTARVLEAMGEPVARTGD